MDFLFSVFLGVMVYIALTSNTAPTYRLRSCTTMQCEQLGTFNTKEKCEEMIKKLESTPHIAEYVCEETK